MPTPIANTWLGQEFYQETPDGLWRMGEVVGIADAEDSTSNGNTATVVGAFVFGGAGFPSDGDTAVTVNGGYMNVGDADTWIA